MGREAEQMARLRWRCRRGMLELDLLLQGFLDSGFAAMGRDEQARFSRLLELPDPLLFDYLVSGVSVREKEFVYVVERIRRTAAH
ncbi:MAG: succinate dehydrogenase assembly factor 2 [Pseudomonadota bacterium]